MGSCGSTTVTEKNDPFVNVANASRDNRPQKNADTDKKTAQQHWDKVRDTVPLLTKDRNSDVQFNKTRDNSHTDPSTEYNRTATNNKTGRIFKPVYTDEEGSQEEYDAETENIEEIPGDTKTFSEEAVLYMKYPELHDVLTGYTATVQFMKNNIDVNAFQNVHIQLENQVWKPYKTNWQKEHRRLMAYHMAKVGFAKALVAYYKYIIYVEQMDYYKESKNPTVSCDLLHLMREVIWKMTSGSKKLAYKFGQAGIIGIMLKDLKILTVQHDEPETRFAIVSALGILYHCAKADSNKQFFKQGNGMQVLRPYLQASKAEIKTAAILTSGYILEEEEVIQLMADKTVIQYVLKMVGIAMESRGHRAEGYSCLELVQGLTVIAVNDEIKRLLVQNGVLPHLTKLIEVGDAQEKHQATKALWTLAFHKENKEEILTDTKIIHLLEDMKQSRESEEQQVAQRALFVLKKDQELKGAQERMARKELGRKKSLERLRSLELERRKSGNINFDHDTDSSDYSIEEEIEEIVEEMNTEHVMISYNWADQRIILKIRDHLVRAGYKVWLDVDQMNGSTLQSMAEAVEDAAVVLICASEKYKQSPNCRTEAEYAYQLRKEVVPLILQRGYKPDGWLGILLGAKLYYDFSGKYNFNQKISDLIRELDGKGKSSVTELPIIPEEAEITGTVQQVKRSVSQWEYIDVAKWLHGNQLERTRKLKHLTGENLLFLQKLNRKAPEFFYGYLQNELGLKELNDLMRFTTALEMI